MSRKSDRPTLKLPTASGDKFVKGKFPPGVRLNHQGQEVLDSKPHTLVIDAFRPPSLEQQVRELTRLGISARDLARSAQFDQFADDDDYHDHLDDVPMEGLSRHEVAGNPELLEAAGLDRNMRPKPPKEPKAPPKPEGAKRPKKAGVAPEGPSEDLSEDE